MWWFTISHGLVDSNIRSSGMKCGPGTQDGYVLIKMIVTEQTWYIVRNTRGVTGFVGSGTDPIPLTDEEIRKMGFEISEINVDYDINDSIEIIDGPFKEYVGIVQEINKEKRKVKVLVSMFGRETPVDLDLAQVQKIK